jgi:glycosyltransferase involved in cell wall biosynthesis
MKIISVLVVNLNNLEYTKNCICDLLNQDIDSNITLIDQGSTEDGTSEYLDDLSKNTHIKVVRNSQNIPLNKIWNDFVENSEDEFVCLLNNDVRICPNFLSSALQIFEKEPGVGFVNHTTNSSEFSEWDYSLNYVIMDQPYRQGWDPIFRKSSYSNIPESLEFFYGDDYIYSKLYENGGKGAYVLNSPILHFERSTTEEKGGKRDCSRDSDAFAQLNLEIINLDFVGLYSKWKPEFTNLHSNMGFFTYKNILLAQTPGIVEIFGQILPQFDNIIEIGFNRGGLSVWLNDNKSERAELICYDITDEFLEVSPGEKINFRIKDCYLPETIKEIENEIKRHGKTLVLCDGGDKNFEFNTFSKFLKCGDVIMCHDYSESIESYIEITSKINWPTPGESFYKKISESVRNHNLLPFKYEEFKNVLWGSFAKGQEMDLSILICSLTERRNSFLDRLLNKLEHQIHNKNVEVLIISDNSKRSIGKKRNDALKISNGRYVCFIDDDDLVSDDFVESILDEIFNWSPDVIVFDALITFDGQNPKLVKYGREFDHEERDDAYYRKPNHLMVHRKSNITEFFEDVKTGEDDEWASRMLDRIVTQSRINKILYYYDYRTTTKKYFE